jgi:hypothetical protein
LGGFAYHVLNRSVGRIGTEHGIEASFEQIETAR